jgi:hypothetical protein
MECFSKVSDLTAERKVSLRRGRLRAVALHVMTKVWHFETDHLPTTITPPYKMLLRCPQITRTVTRTPFTSIRPSRAHFSLFNWGKEDPKPSQPKPSSAQPSQPSQAAKPVAHPQALSTPPSKSTKSLTEKQKQALEHMDDELKAKMAGIAGDGGESGVEYEDGKPVSMKRSVKVSVVKSSRQD